MLVAGVGFVCGNGNIRIRQQSDDLAGRHHLDTAGHIAKQYLADGMLVAAVGFVCGGSKYGHSKSGNRISRRHHLDGI